VVLAERFEVAGPRPLKLGAETSEISWSTSMRIMLLSLTLGTIFIRSATSCRCTPTDGKEPSPRPAAPCCPGRPAHAAEAAEELPREGQVLTDGDLALLVVRDEEARVRQHVDVVVRLQELQERAERRQLHRRAEDLQVLGGDRGAEQRARRGRPGSRSGPPG
jgi:hypothetical protein